MQNIQPISKLIQILNLPKIPDIPRGLTKRNYKEYLKLSKLKKQIAKQRKEILSKYKVANMIDHEYSGYSKSAIYYYNGIYYN